MRNKGWHNKPYQKLIYKIFTQTLMIIFMAVFVVIILRSVGYGKIGNLIVRIYCSLYDVDWNTGVIFYNAKIRRHYDFILIGSMFIMFLIFFRLLLSWFTKYFDQIIDGVNKLADKKDQPIHMSPELGFMSEKLIQVRSELEHSREMEREVEKRKNDLVVYLAHDIKTPLTSVIGYLNLLNDAPDMPEEQKQKYFHITLEKAYRLEKLINEFFEITRYNLQTVPLNKEKVDLCYMMVQIVDELYPQLTESGKTVSTQIPEDLTIYADPEKMARVFNNILKNAISYSNTESTIGIFGEYQEKSIIIRFENDGTIPQDKLDFIFEKFYRLDESRQTATGGAGLGLAIAKDILVLHNGTISADCKNNRIVFTITLPNIQ